MFPLLYFNNYLTIPKYTVNHQPETRFFPFGGILKQLDFLYDFN